MRRNRNWFHFIQYSLWLWMQMNSLDSVLFLFAVHLHKFHTYEKINNICTHIFRYAIYTSDFVQETLMSLYICLMIRCGFFCIRQWRKKKESVSVSRSLPLHFACLSLCEWNHSLKKFTVPCKLHSNELTRMRVRVCERSSGKNSSFINQNKRSNHWNIEFIKLSPYQLYQPTATNFDAIR